MVGEGDMQEVGLICRDLPALFACMLPGGSRNFRFWSATDLFLYGHSGAITASPSSHKPLWNSYGGGHRDLHSHLAGAGNARLPLCHETIGMWLIRNAAVYC